MSRLCNFAKTILAFVSSHVFIHICPLLQMVSILYAMHHTRQAGSQRCDQRCHCCKNTNLVLSAHVYFHTLGSFLHVIGHRHMLVFQPVSPTASKLTTQYGCSWVLAGMLLFSILRSIGQVERIIRETTGWPMQRWLPLTCWAIHTLDRYSCASTLPPPAVR